MVDNGLWIFFNWDEKFLEFKYNENYVIIVLLVLDNMVNEENVVIYVDLKGVVMYV